MPGIIDSDITSTSATFLDNLPGIRQLNEACADNGFLRAVGGAAAACADRVSSIRASVPTSMAELKSTMGIGQGPQLAPSGPQVAQEISPDAVARPVQEDMRPQLGGKDHDALVAAQKQFAACGVTCDVQQQMDINDIQVAHTAMNVDRSQQVGRA